ncbi:hypothetical protein HanIR_Chr17g0857211 [Helianthus annuus]|nr:hypothetical protein HanIR_Chr17g0857211 [Helianthus annuus]
MGTSPKRFRVLGTATIRFGDGEYKFRGRRIQVSGTYPIIFMGLSFKSFEFHNKQSAFQLENPINIQLYKPLAFQFLLFSIHHHLSSIIASQETQGSSTTRLYLYFLYFFCRTRILDF